MLEPGQQKYATGPEDGLDMPKSSELEPPSRTTRAVDCERENEPGLLDVHPL